MKTSATFISPQERAASVSRTLQVSGTLRNVLTLLLAFAWFSPLPAAAQNEQSGENAKPQAPSAQKPANDVQDLLFLGTDHPYVIRLHVRMDGQSFRKFWNAQTTKLFNQLDLDGDGTLSNAEAQRIDQQNLVPEKSFLEKLFSAGKQETPRLAADSGDFDGKVTRDELAAYLRQSGLGPFTTRSNPYAARDVYYGNRNDQTAAEMLYQYVDLDKNKQLAADELSAAADFLQPLDLDDDEVITVDELGTGRNMYASPQYYNDDPGGNSGFLAFSRTGKLDRPLNRIMQKYASKPASDSQKDDATTAIKPDAESPAPIAARILNRQALGWQEEFFARYDGDSSGTLEEAELRRYLADPLPALELIVRRGKKKKSESRIEVLHQEAAVAPQMSVRTLGDNFLVVDFGRDRLELAGNTSSGTAGGNFDSFYEQQFDAVDRDNNEYLEAKEVRRQYYFESTFKLMDADGDGKLFKKEMTAWLDRQNESARSRTVMVVGDRGHNLFDAVDADGDRKLSLRERGSLADRLLRFDRNHDKQISTDELPRQLRVTITQGQPGIQGFGVAFASDAGTSAGRRARSGPNWFLKMDVNNDGDVSPREFLGPRTHFTRLDADADGLIDAREAARFD